MRELEVYAVTMFDRGGPTRATRRIVATSETEARRIASSWPGVVEHIEFDCYAYTETERS